MRVLHLALDRVEEAFAFLAGCLLVVTVILVPIDVASRYFFNAPITWVFEVTEYILLFVPCLGMAWLARANGHVAIDILTSRLPSLGRRFLGFACSAVASSICAFIAWWGALVTLESFRAGAVIENVLQTPQWLIYISIPAGFGLCAIEFARKALTAGPGEAPEPASERR